MSDPYGNWKDFWWTFALVHIGFAAFFGMMIALGVIFS